MTHLIARMVYSPPRRSWSTNQPRQKITTICRRALNSVSGQKHAERAGALNSRGKAVRRMPRVRPMVLAGSARIPDRVFKRHKAHRPPNAWDRHASITGRRRHRGALFALRWRSHARREEHRESMRGHVSCNCQFVLCVGSR